jgi:LPXTG-site transpeptidase (sortase) family protein
VVKIVERIKSLWLIIIGGLLLIVGIGGTLISVFDIFGISVENYEEWDLTIADSGFAPYALPVSARDEFAPVIAWDLTPDPEVRITPSVSETRDPDLPIIEDQIDPTLIPTQRRLLVIPSRLIIPTIDLDTEIVPAKPKGIRIGGETYEQWQAPDKFAVGWHTTSAVLGQIGNTVLNGHHNVEGQVFENLHKVQPGDKLLILGGIVQFEYMIVNVMIIPERNVDVETRLENARWILPSADERITLVTCWPAWSNTHRLVVVAQPIGDYIELEVTPTILENDN